MENNNEILVYDDACPMCVWYTGAFVETGLLPKNGRTAFSTLDLGTLGKINWQRSKNEIPLLDTKTGEVIYGIDAMLEVLGYRFPLIKKIGHWEPIHCFLRKFYKFISYNRKVIVAKRSMPGTIDCTPDFSLSYRLLFMAIFLTFNTIMLFPIHQTLLLKIPGYTLSVVQLQLLHTALVACNILLASLMGKRKAVDYLGQINMLALLTILSLLPLLFLNSLINPGKWVNIIYLILVGLFLIAEYSRRMHYADIPQKLSWVKLVNLVSVVAFVLMLFIF